MKKTSQVFGREVSGSMGAIWFEFEKEYISTKSICEDYWGWTGFFYFDVPPGTFVGYQIYKGVESLEKVKVFTEDLD